MAADRVVMELEGLMLERFIDRALGSGARFTRIERPGRRLLRLHTDSAGARTVRLLAEKYSMPCRVISLHGFSLFRAYIGKRRTLPAAFLMFFICCALYFSRVWIINVELINGEALPAGVDSVLAEAGIIKGRYFGGMDLSLASMKLTALDGCAHASVSRRGVTVTARIACEHPAPEVYSIDGEGDLIALCDGVISSVSVKSGTAMVKPGDTVRAGQVLISGYERTGAESVRDVPALGTVTARIWVTGESSSPTVVAEKRYTGRTRRQLKLRTPWLEYASGAAADGGTWEAHVRSVEIGGLFVPLYMDAVLLREYALYEAGVDLTAAKAHLTAESEKNALQNAPEGAEIIDKWTDFSMIESEDIIHARTVVELETEIAAARGYMEENQIE